jgi:hypothetical protein
MALSDNLVKRILHAVTDQDLGRELVDAVNKGAAQAAQDLYVIPTIIVATSTSTTTDFGALKVGDRVVKIPAVAGNSIFYTVATAGTLPAAAVVGDLYVVLRAFAADAASTLKL